MSTTTTKNSTKIPASRTRPRTEVSHGPRIGLRQKDWRNGPGSSSGRGSRSSHCLARRPAARDDEARPRRSRSSRCAARRTSDLRTERRLDLRAFVMQDLLVCRAHAAGPARSCSVLR